MKKVIDKAESRGRSLYDWLDSYHTFSFDGYYNPRRMNFGALRVLNDDRIAPGKGFGTHPHKNMEIITIPLKGRLQHGDSKQNHRTITPGYIQTMTSVPTCTRTSLPSSCLPTATLPPKCCNKPGSPLERWKPEKRRATTCTSHTQKCTYS